MIYSATYMNQILIIVFIFSQDYAAQNPSVKPVEDNNLKAEGKKENKKEIDENEKEDVLGLKGTA